MTQPSDADKWRRQRETVIARHSHEIMGIVLDALTRRDGVAMWSWLEAMKVKINARIGMVFDDCVPKPTDAVGKPPTGPTPPKGRQ